MELTQEAINQKEYNRNYYLKKRDERRKKVICDKCGRTVCSEYLEKHKEKRICKKIDSNNNSA